MLNSSKLTLHLWTAELLCSRFFSRRSRRRWRRRFRRFSRRLPRYIQRGRQWYNRYQAARAIWALYG